MSTQQQRATKEVQVRDRRNGRRVDWTPTWGDPAEKRVRIDVYDELDNYEVVDARGRRLPGWTVSYS